VCVNDVPYVDYTVTPQNFTPSGSGATIVWETLGGRRVLTLTGQALTGRLLWPGASIDGGGNGTGWPGWELTPSGWVTVPTDLLPQMRVFVTVNPTTDGLVSYPPAAPRCVARPPDDPTAVQLASASATRAGAAVRVQWTSLAEFATTGYEIYRAPANCAQCVAQLVRFVYAHGTGDYTLTDHAATRGMAYIYRIVEVDEHGKRTVLTQLRVGAGGSAVFLPALVTD
jgi:hypothetical protein